MNLEDSDRTLSNILKSDFSDSQVRNSLSFRISSSNNLNLNVYHDFVDRYIIKSIRKPSNVNIPTLIIDENM